jgi:hypothetical protein
VFWIQALLLRIVKWWKIVVARRGFQMPRVSDSEMQKEKEKVRKYAFDAS